MTVRNSLAKNRCRAVIFGRMHKFIRFSSVSITKREKKLEEKKKSKQGNTFLLRNVKIQHRRTSSIVAYLIRFFLKKILNGVEGHEYRGYGSG